MQELKDLQGLCVAARWAQQQELVLEYGVEESGRVGVGEVYQRGARLGVSEVQREQGAGGRRAAGVGVFEERCAADSVSGQSCARASRERYLCSSKM